MSSTAMFTTTIRSSLDERSRRSWITLTSFGLQAVALTVLLIAPLLKPVGLPLLRQLSTPVSLGRPGGDTAVTRTRGGSGTSTVIFSTSVFRSPSTLPGARNAEIDDGPPQIGPVGPYGQNGIGDSHGLPNLFGSNAQPVMPIAPTRPIVHTVRLSHMSEGNLIRKIVPEYPPLARSARIQGQVVLQALISKEGTIENLRLLSGHPMLAPAAIEAVKQWRYKPYVLNNEPVEVETQITVNFSLGGN
jgi:periplasmic protein TonB